MQKKLYMKVYAFMLIMLMASCSNVDDTIKNEEDHDGNNNISETNEAIYQQTINDFKATIVHNDAQALYNLVDVNYEEEVYWTLSEARDMVDFYSENYFLYEQELNSLEESIHTLKHIKKTEESAKRIPFAPSNEGLLYLEPNGKLSVKMFKHTLFVSGDSLDGYDEIVLEYENTDKTFTFDQAYLKNNKYKNHKNEEVVDLMYFGPGNYTIQSVGISGDEQAKYTETIELSQHDFNVGKDKKSMKVIHLYLK